MKVTVTGMRDVKFTPEGSSNVIEGRQIFYLAPVNHGIGQYTEKKFLSASQYDLRSLPWGTGEFELECDLRGQVLSMKQLNK